MASLTEPGWRTKKRRLLVWASKFVNPHRILAISSLLLLEIQQDQQ